ncbi:MAG: TonB-dependent receptor plug domain-containing protein [Bacteroidales bacterium]|nr:TonB-dependent receptor plug domain-containing protein [Bacteroidales bacterium]
MRNVFFFLAVSLYVLMFAAACGTPARTPSGVVDIGYQNAAKDDLSYSVSSLQPAEGESFYTNMYDYLRGRVAGVEVGPENTPSSIRIRGVNSINSSTAPLILVDGVETDLDSVNPNDVQSVSVLKDSSSSIYGVRGGNGVILINTKKGQKKK